MVALLAEGVDRNVIFLYLKSLPQLSPSSRRAWIEIAKRLLQMTSRWVALLAEGVDRNHKIRFGVKK